ncbi:ABC-type nitrate/sulfonate/bicarbonate transport system substrate-binding protein [Bradyrhizobium ottawaense]
MTGITRRILLAGAVALAMTPAAKAADPLKEIRIDWATYNPVSMVLKQKGLLEKEFAKDGITVTWVQSAGSNKALEFLNAGSIDFGSTAGSAALVARINGNPIKSIYVYSRPEWTALVTSKDSKIAGVADLKGKRVAVTRGTDPHIFLVRALLGAGLTEKDITPVLLQHADGKTALIRGDVDAWGRPRSDDGAGRGRGGRKAVLPQGRRQHLGHPQCARAVFEGPSRRCPPRPRGV